MRVVAVYRSQAMPRVKVMRRRPDWADARPVLSTNRVAGLLGVGWSTALELMSSGRIPSKRIGVRSQAYYRTSMRDVRADMAAVEGQS
jgi:predicted DNA-binding transcriptional regulator AlpA